MGSPGGPPSGSRSPGLSLPRAAAIGPGMGWGSQWFLSSLPQEAVTFDFGMMNAQPADTVATAALILPGHPTGEQKAARSLPRLR